MTRITELLERQPRLSYIIEHIKNAYRLMHDTCEIDHKILICGNGGSAADAQHFVGELGKSFLLQRPLDASLKDILKAINCEKGSKLAEKLQKGFKVMSLMGEASLISAIINDVGADYIFAQQIMNFGENKDLLICFTTSGNSTNVVNAAITAKALGMKVLSFTAMSGGEIKKISDICLTVPSDKVYHVQEYHLAIYHTLSLMLEEDFFGKDK
jgi:D-sedoheptulose 7-phosphate isomerase